MRAREKIIKVVFCNKKRPLVEGKFSVEVLAICCCWWAVTRNVIFICKPITNKPVNWEINPAVDKKYICGSLLCRQVLFSIHHIFVIVIFFAECQHLSTTLSKFLIPSDAGLISLRWFDCRWFFFWCFIHYDIVSVWCKLLKFSFIHWTFFASFYFIVLSYSKRIDKLECSKLLRETYSRELAASQSAYSATTVSRTSSLE